MSPIDADLTGKVALITGAGRGIGRAISISYAAAGASVCCVARTRSEIDRTVTDIRHNGGTAIAAQADVTDYDSVVRAFEAAAREFGGIDIVVINAGGNLDESHDIESGSPEEWAYTVQVNLIGSYHTAHAAIPHLKKRGAGKIIAIGSGIGHRGRPGESAYASAKAGLSMLVRVLAQELWPHSISVNELIPGPSSPNGSPGRTPHAPTPSSRSTASGSSPPKKSCPSPSSSPHSPTKAPPPRPTASCAAIPNADLLFSRA